MREGHIRLPAYYGDHMVLQQKVRSKLYGLARPYEEITLTLERQAAGKNGPYTPFFQEQERSEEDGFFEIRLPYVEASLDRFRIKLRAGSEEVLLDDVRFGEVFLAAGEGNMSMPLRLSDGASLRSNLGEQIRLFWPRETGLPEGEENYSFRPQSKIAGARWLLANDGEQILDAPALPLAFAWHLAEHKPELPIAVYCLAVTDSCIHSWLPLELVKQRALLKNTTRERHFYRDQANWNELPETELPDSRTPQVLAQDKDPLARPLAFSRKNQVGAIFNHKLAPLMGLAIRSILWYQGESDVHYPDYYAQAFRELVGVFLELFQAPAGGLSLVYSQLSPFSCSAREHTSLAIFNEALAAVRRSLPIRAGMVTNYDLPLDFHRGLGPWDYPQNPIAKLKLAERMQMLVRGLAYQEDMPTSAPECIQAEVVGNKWMLTFDQVGKGLELLPGEKQVKGFAVCSAEGTYVNAKAKTLYGVRCLAWHPEITEPTSCSYAFTSLNQSANICSSHGLPLVPFRLERQAKKYALPLEFCYCDRLSSWQYPSRQDHPHRFDRQDWPSYLPLWQVAEGRGRFLLEKEHKRSGAYALLLQYKKADEYPLSFGPVLDYASLHPPLDIHEWTELRLHVFNADRRLKQFRFYLADQNGRSYTSPIIQLSDLLVWQEVPLVLKFLPIDLMRITKLEFSLLDPQERGTLYLDALSFHGYHASEGRSDIMEQ